jgi:hypothetical protein
MAPSFCHLATFIYDGRATPPDSGGFPTDAIGTVERAIPRERSQLANSEPLERYAIDGNRIMNAARRARLSRSRTPVESTSV